VKKVWTEVITTQNCLRLGEFMNRLKEMCTVLSVFAALAIFSTALSAAEGNVPNKEADASAQYCHLKFPAITEESLFSDRPVLKSSSDGDIIDFYGPCNFDPLGKESVSKQRADLQRERRRQYDNSN
jgi:hypothetical protein